MVNRSLGNLLRILIGDRPKQQGMLLSQAYFAYNNLVNRLNGVSPFHVVYGRSPRGVTNLVKVITDRKNVDEEDFNKHIK